MYLENFGQLLNFRYLVKEKQSKSISNAAFLRDMVHCFVKKEQKNTSFQHFLISSAYFQKLSLERSIKLRNVW